MRRFYVECDLDVGKEIVLPASVAHHVQGVLRCQVGNHIKLFNPKAGDYVCQIVAIGQGVSVEIIERQACHRESPFAVHLIQALSRSQKIDWVIQKSVELGVARLSLVVSDRSVMKVRDVKKKMDHWQQVVIQACQQCGRARVPRLDFCNTLGQALVLLDSEAIKWLLDPMASESLPAASQSIKQAVIAIGPEGGYSPNEQGLLEQNQFESIRFGPRVLRTETAAVAVLAALQCLYGDC